MRHRGVQGRVPQGRLLEDPEKGLQKAVLLRRVARKELLCSLRVRTQSSDVLKPPNFLPDLTGNNEVHKVDVNLAERLFRLVNKVKPSFKQNAYLLALRDARQVGLEADLGTEGLPVCQLVGVGSKGLVKVVDELPCFLLLRQLGRVSCNRTLRSPLGRLNDNFGQHFR